MLKRNNWFLPLLLSVCLLSAVANLVWAQEDSTDDVDSSAPPISADAAFARYCAPCHGDDGRGNGKMAFGLSKPAPDLTHLAMRNGGAFPRERVARLIDGREQMDSHNREMPIWGDWFKLEAEKDLRDQRETKPKSGSASMLWWTFFNRCKSTNTRPS